MTMRWTHAILCAALTLTPAGSALAVSSTGDQAAEPEPPEATDSATEPPSEPEEPPEEPRTVNLIIQGSDPDPWNLDVGGGWNDLDGLYGRIALSTNNLLGRGELLGLKLELGDERELYEVEYRRPFLFGRRQYLGLRLFRDATQRPVAGGADFEQERAGGILSYGRRFGAHHSFDLDLRIADVDQNELAIGPDDQELTRQASYVHAALRPSWVYDRLDSRASPFRGLRLAGTLEWADQALGGDSGLLKPVLGATWFQPVTTGRLRSTLSLRARFGWLGKTSGEIFPQQRFFLGGEDSVRGFLRNSIAALEDDGSLARDDDGFPIGGDRLAQINLEYHLLLGGPFRLVLFADAGSVVAEGQSFDLDRARTSAGAELRLKLKKMPVPLRLIYAHNLDPLPEDRFKNFSFSFGLSF
ncbi:MAG: BamA/TamA family outer membrane protein [Acidobacteriota bacterium]